MTLNVGRLVIKSTHVGECDNDADLTNKWQHSFTRREQAMIISGASKIPHFEKQNGIAKIETPMMLLAVVIISLMDMLKPSIFKPSCLNKIQDYFLCRAFSSNL